MKRKTPVLAAVAAVAVLAGAFWAVKSFRGADARPETHEDGKRKTDGTVKVAAAPARKGRAAAGRKARGTNVVARIKRTRTVRLEDSYTPAERLLADRLQSALDGNRLADVREAVAKMKGQKNPDLKIEAIDALGFFGKEALSDLLPFLRDVSQDVVDSAVSRISSVLDELEENEKEFKADFITTMLSTRGLCNAEATDQFVGQLESIGSDDEKLAVRMIAQLIEGEEIGEKIKARAKEAYAFVTGDAYTTFEAAEKWYAEKVAEEEAEKAEEQEDETDGDVAG
jgi:hypothetical protein